ncbi:MAG: hypothetical protein NT069_04090 [Planctomycetota bacterium]|nr:hypothetical protein [Planctomycetota bacterium]
MNRGDESEPGGQDAKTRSNHNDKSDSKTALNLPEDGFLTRPAEAALET